MKSKKILPFIFMLLLLFFLISGQEGCENECRKDSECVKVQVTCCPCESGGIEKCVPRYLKPLYEKKLRNCPKPNETIGVGKYNCVIKNCSCRNGKCVENLKKR